MLSTVSQPGLYETASDVRTGAGFWTFLLHISKRCVCISLSDFSIAASAPYWFNKSPFSQVFNVFSRRKPSIKTAAAYHSLMSSINRSHLFIYFARRLRLMRCLLPQPMRSQQAALGYGQPTNTICISISQHATWYPLSPDSVILRGIEKKSQLECVAAKLLLGRRNPIVSKICWGHYEHVYYARNIYRKAIYYSSPSSGCCHCATYTTVILALRPWAFALAKRHCDVLTPVWRNVFAESDRLEGGNSWWRQQ